MLICLLVQQSIRLCLTFILAVEQMKGVNVEAVLRVEDDEENGGKRKNKSRQKEVEDDLGLSMLIDSQNNQYILTKPRDSTMPRADHHFIKVSLFLLLRSFYSESI